MMHFHPFIFDVELIQSVIAGEVKHVMISCGFETFQMFYFFFSHVVKHVAHKYKGL